MHEHRRRRLVAAVAAAAASTVALVAGAGAPAVAGSALPPITPGASAYAAAAATGTASISPNLQLSGSLGKLLDPLINPIIDQALNPLVAALQNTANTVVAGTLGSAGSLNASTTPGQLQYGTAPTPFPNDTLPSPCVSSGSQPCYSAATTNVAAPPLASVQLGALSGYVEQVAASADATNPIFGRSSATSPSVSVLPGIGTLLPASPSITNPIISASAVNAKAKCPNDGAAGATKPATAPSAGLSATAVNVLGGLVKFDVASGQITNLVVNNTSYASLLSLPTVTALGVTISPYSGTSLLLSIPLSLSQVIAGFGLSGSVGSQLTQYASSSTLALRIVIGPSSTLTTRSASAWGLGIGVDLAGALNFNLLNLATATVNVPSGIGGSNLGNLLDLRLAYASCQSGVVMPATVQAVPPTLV